MRIVALIICLQALPAAAQAVKADAEVVELRAVIGKIVDIKSQTSKESNEWQGRKATMAALLELHRQELSLLAEELEGAGQSAGGYDEKKRQTEGELARLKAARRVAGLAVLRNRERMLALTKKFPQPLADDTEIERSVLELWRQGDQARDGLQAILGMVTKAEQFNRRITRSQEERDGRLVEVIYLGLARAYYADRGGNAGIGEPGPDGWEWKSQASINGEVVKALDELDKKRPPELVELPLKIEEVRK